MGEEKSGNAVYSKIKEEVKHLRERLKAAGVNRDIPGVTEEEEYYDEEDDEKDDEEEEGAKDEPESLEDQ